MTPRNTLLLAGLAVVTAAAHAQLPPGPVPGGPAPGLAETVALPSPAPAPAPAPLPAVSPAVLPAAVAPVVPAAAPAEAVPPAAADAAPPGTNVVTTSRDPFWPVGYVPVARRPRVKPAGASVSAPGAIAEAAGPAVAPKPPDWDEARRHIEIRGITRIGRDKTTGRETYFAMINGRMTEEGEVVSVTWDGRTYRWRVGTIGAEGLQLVKLDAKAE